MASLKKELAKYLTTNLIQAGRGLEPAVVLVVDSRTSKILSSCLRMYDIMQQGVVVIEPIYLKREKLPDLPAIYFIEPSSESIQHLVDDFPENCIAGPEAAAKKKGIIPASYLNASLFFTQHVTDDKFDIIRGSKGNVTKFLKTFIELSVDFLSFETRVFLCDKPRLFSDLYFPTIHLDTTLQSITAPLVSFFVTMNEYPHIRYSTVGKKNITQTVASMFEQNMKKTLSQLPNWKAAENRERGTLLVVDRSIDPLTPLLHEFTYQAMIVDVLGLEGEVLPTNVLESVNASSSSSEAPEEYVLSEDDDLWLEYRHEHFATVLTNISTKFKEFKSNNKAAALNSKDKGSDMRDLRKAVEDLPEFQNLMKKYSKHFNIVFELNDRISKCKLFELANLELDMATGLNSDGGKAEGKQIKENLMNLCKDPNIAILDKLRLLMIYITALGGIQESSRKELMSNVDPELQVAIRNLEILGVDISPDKKKKIPEDRLKEFKEKAASSTLALTRYEPVLKKVAESLCRGALDEESYPYASPPPPGSNPLGASSSSSATSARKGVSARKKPGDWKSGDSAPATTQGPPEEDNRPRFYIFVVGGVTSSEMRLAYEIADRYNVNLYIGSTEVLSPKNYVRELSKMAPELFAEAIAKPFNSKAAAASNKSSGRGGDIEMQDM